MLYPMSPLTSFSGLLVPEFAADLSANNRMRMNRISSAALGATLTYSALCSVFLYSFSAELAETVYRSSEAAEYLAILATVVPIMYLDHVTDSMLKGVGDHVYSMWVNITDSLLSLVLVYFLIPSMGIVGYALVIIIMESYNFLLSYFRLMKRVNFRISIVRSLILPALIASFSVWVSDTVLLFGGVMTASRLIIRIVFALCLFVAMKSLLDCCASLYADKKQSKISLKKGQMP